MLSSSTIPHVNRLRRLFTNVLPYRRKLKTNYYNFNIHFWTFPVIKSDTCFICYNSFISYFVPLDQSLGVKRNSFDKLYSITKAWTWNLITSYRLMHSKIRIANNENKLLIIWEKRKFLINLLSLMVIWTGLLFMSNLNMEFCFSIEAWNHNRNRNNI